MEYRYVSCWQERAGVYGMLESPIHHLPGDCNAVRIEEDASVRSNTRTL